MPVSVKTYSASAIADASANTKNGQTITASASASASSNISYDAAYQIALASAKSTAQENADYQASLITSDCCCLETFNASASAEGVAYTNNGEKVTATASATASSTLSYNDAYQIALSNAQSIALQNANNDANIINQSFPGLITLNSTTAPNNTYNVADNSNYYYLKGSSSNAPPAPPVPGSVRAPSGSNLPATFFDLGITGSYASAVDSKGNFYIGGTFTTTVAKQLSVSNGISTVFNNIAMWNGSSWAPLGLGLNSTVRAIVIDQLDNVYVGGDFTYLGDNVTIANNVAKWTPSPGPSGGSWSVLGTSQYNGVSQGLVVNTTTTPPGYSPVTTTSLNTTTSVVNALAIDKYNNVYVGGNFTILNDGSATSVNSIAKWIPSNLGGSWSLLGNSQPNSTYTLTGNIVTIPALSGIVLSNGVALQNNFGVSSGTLILSYYAGIVNTLGVDSYNNLYVGGSFTFTFNDISSINANVINSNYIAKWTPTTSAFPNGIPTGVWSVVGANNTYNGTTNTVNALAIDSLNNVYIGGLFMAVSNGSLIFANRIAKWTPSTILGGTGTFSSLGISNSVNTTDNANGVNNTVNALVVDSSNNVYVGGSFTQLNVNSNYTTTTVYNIFANYIAKWTPSISNLIQQPTITGAWSTVGNTPSITVNGLPSSVKSLSINTKNNTLYTGSIVPTRNTSYVLSTDYINLYYNNVLIYQLYQTGQIISIYTSNINGQKICSVINSNPTYQNYF